MNVMLPPAQMVVVVEMMDTDGTTLEAVIVISLLVAVGVVAHGSLPVNTTVTLSLLARVVVVNKLLLVPAFVPFTFHW